MEDLIFVLPTFIIFFIILFQVFSLFKRGFDFVRKRFDLTIDQAGEKIKKRSRKMDADYDRNQSKNRSVEAEFESIAESKKRLLNQNEKSENINKGSQRQKQERLKKESLEQEKTKNKSSSLGEIFAQYNEVEKAVIYNEILSKPKALKNN